MLHRGWRPVEMNIDNEIKQTIYKANSSTPRGVVAFITGHESSGVLFPRQIRALRKQGFSVVNLPLLNARQSDNMNIENAKLVERFLFDDCSAIHDPEYDGLPKFVLTHSEGGLRFLQATEMSDNAHRAQQDFKAIYHTNTYFGPANASRIPDNLGASFSEKLKTSIAEDFYKLYVSLCAHDKELGKSFVDRAFLYLKRCELKDVFEAAKDIPAIRNATISSTKDIARKLKSLLQNHDEHAEKNVFQPTDAYLAPLHSQALALYETGLETLDRSIGRKYLTPQDPLFHLNQKFFLSPNDPASSWTLGFYAATLFNAPLHNCSGEHVALDEDKNILPKIIADMKSLSDPYASPADIKAEASITTDPPRTFAIA